MQGQAKEFYAEHKERPFFGGLVNFMTSGEAVLMILQKDNAIKDWRAFMGPTNSIKVPTKRFPIDSLRVSGRGGGGGGGYASASAEGQSG